MSRLESEAEKRLREAIERGEFDNLPGKGKPLDLAENPFEDPDLRMVHRLLRNAGFAPAWIEERKDIDVQFQSAATKLERAWKLFGRLRPDESHPEWLRNLREFSDLVAELNERIRIYNLKAPAAVFHRRVIDVAQVVAQIKAA